MLERIQQSQIHREGEETIVLPSRRRFYPSRLGWLRLAVGLVVFALLFGAWILATQDEAHSFLLASPASVWKQLGESLADGSLIRHTAITLIEAALGFALGAGAAFILGYGIAKSRLLELSIGPYLVGLQAVPIVAIGPALIIFFGPGLFVISVICALIVFFPMLVSTIVGIRNIHPDLRDTMRSLVATRWQTFTKLEVPAALPVLFGGLKISITLSVAGAVVGEAVNPRAGLGFLIYSAFYFFKQAQVLLGIFTVVALALTLYYAVALAEHRFLRWRRKYRADG